MRTLGFYQTILRPICLFDINPASWVSQRGLEPLFMPLVIKSSLNLDYVLKIWMQVLIKYRISTGVST